MTLGIPGPGLIPAVGPRVARHMRSLHRGDMDDVRRKVGGYLLPVLHRAIRDIVGSGKDTNMEARLSFLAAFMEQIAEPMGRLFAGCLAPQERNDPTAPSASGTFTSDLGWDGGGGMPTGMGEDRESAAIRAVKEMAKMSKPKRPSPEARLENLCAARKLLMDQWAEALRHNLDGGSGVVPLPDRDVIQRLDRTIAETVRECAGASEDEGMDVDVIREAADAAELGGVGIPVQSV